jgi:hypothetical protein
MEFSLKELYSGEVTVEDEIINVLDNNASTKSLIKNAYFRTEATDAVFDLYVDDYRIKRDVMCLQDSTVKFEDMNLVVEKDSQLKFGIKSIASTVDNELSYNTGFSYTSSGTPKSAMVTSNGYFASINYDTTSKTTQLVIVNPSGEHRYINYTSMIEGMPNSVILETDNYLVFMYIWGAATNMGINIITLPIDDLDLGTYQDANVSLSSKSYNPTFSNVLDATVVSGDEFVAFVYLGDGNERKLAKIDASNIAVACVGWNYFSPVDASITGFNLSTTNANAKLASDGTNIYLALAGGQTGYKTHLWKFTSSSSTPSSNYEVATNVDTSSSKNSMFGLACDDNYVYLLQRESSNIGYYKINNVDLSVLDSNSSGDYYYPSAAGVTEANIHAVNGLIIISTNYPSDNTKGVHFLTIDDSGTILEQYDSSVSGVLASPEAFRNQKFSNEGIWCGAHSSNAKYVQTKEYGIVVKFDGVEITD